MVRAPLGIPSITTRAVAGRVGLSAGTLANHLRNREHMLRVCGQRFADRWLVRLDERVTRRGPAGALPATDDEHLWDRVWLGWQELARDDDVLAHTVTEARRREQGLLAHAVWPGARGDPFPIERADTTLGRFLASLGQVSERPVFCATLDGSG